MKIKLYQDVKDVGKAGAVIDVTEVIGNYLNGRGECNIVQHDPPTKAMKVSPIVAMPEGGGNADAK